MEKKHRNAEVRYTAGTRNDRRLWQNGTEHENPMDVQEEIDRMRDAHRRTALALVCRLLRDDPSLNRGLLLLRLRTAHQVASSQNADSGYLPCSRQYARQGPGASSRACRAQRTSFRPAGGREERPARRTNRAT